MASPEIYTIRLGWTASRGEIHLATGSNDLKTGEPLGDITQCGRDPIVASWSRTGSRDILEKSMSCERCIAIFRGMRYL